MFNQHKENRKEITNGKVKHEHTEVLETEVHKRKITIARDVYPSRSRGEFHVTLYAKNRGNTNITNLCLKDIIPEGFKLLEEDKVIKSQDRGKEREWFLNKLSSGEEIEVSYKLIKIGDKCKGESLLDSY